MQSAESHVPGILSDLLPATILASQLVQPRNHRGEQLHHDGCADVRHDPKGKDGAMLKRAAGENIEKSGHAPAGRLRHRGLKPLI